MGHRRNQISNCSCRTGYDIMSFRIRSTDGATRSFTCESKSSRRVRRGRRWRSPIPEVKPRFGCYRSIGPCAPEEPVLGACPGKPGDSITRLAWTKCAITPASTSSRNRAESVVEADHFGRRLGAATPSVAWSTPPRSPTSRCSSRRDKAWAVSGELRWAGRSAYY